MTGRYLKEKSSAGLPLGKSRFIREGAMRKTIGLSHEPKAGYVDR
jgi:hypothetical protein